MRLILPGNRVCVTDRVRLDEREPPPGPPYPSTFGRVRDFSRWVHWCDSIKYLTGRDVTSYLIVDINRWLWKGGWPP